jgi:uncharacterized protein YbcV (DUF1398 family)
MDAKLKDVMIECTRASDEERASFPEVVMQLIATGVERYHTDLVRGSKTYYLPNGESEMVAGDPLTLAAAAEFSAAGVAAAVKSIQGGKIQYKEFCRRIAQAGCVGYIVSVAGKRAVYYGRTGDSYVEWFPGARKEEAA